MWTNEKRRESERKWVRKKWRTEKHIRINKQWLHEFLSRRRFYCHVFFPIYFSLCFIASENTTKIFIPPCHRFESTFIFILSRSVYLWVGHGRCSTDVYILSSGGAREISFTISNLEAKTACIYCMFKQNKQISNSKMHTLTLTMNQKWKIRERLTQTTFTRQIFCVCFSKKKCKQANSLCLNNGNGVQIDTQKMLNSFDYWRKVKE